MAIRVKIDFENIYELEGISEDLRISSFQTELQSGQKIPLKIKISNEAHAILPDVYNLAFGPLNSRGQIDDKAELPHSNYSRVFSSILLTALNYLTSNQHHYLGIDGSDNFRAYYYWRFLQATLITWLNILKYLVLSIMSESPVTANTSMIIHLILRISNLILTGFLKQMSGRTTYIITSLSG